MAGNKTRDGLRINDLVKLAMQAGARIREGNSHAYILNYEGLRPCPIATSTHAERMVAPWLATATGRTKHETYEALRRGYW
ncbi:Uncharacterised protein [uncultured archaeon]|nr:Uncharacterised protein [uncultured archaeon]